MLKTSSWLNGYRVYTDADGNANDETDKALRIINRLDLATASLSSPSTNDIVFNTDGTLADDNGEPLTLVDENNTYTADINPIGHVSISRAISGE